MYYKCFEFFMVMWRLRRAEYILGIGLRMSKYMLIYVYIAHTQIRFLHLLRDIQSFFFLRLCRNLDEMANIGIWIQRTKIYIAYADHEMVLFLWSYVIIERGYLSIKYLTRWFSAVYSFDV